MNPQLTSARSLETRTATRSRRPIACLAAAVAAAALAVAAPTRADDWTFWRGPDQVGVSGETGLVSSWSPEGENLAWKADFVGRSTPVVVDGRVCVIGRHGEKETVEQLERVACFDAGTGDLLWDDRYPIYHTTVAFNRAGWASPAADPATGYVYTHGAAGQLNAYDAEGKIVWSCFLPELNGRASGYGGRTQTPLIDGDMLIVGFVNAGWGDQAAPRHRYFAFDKRTGELVWVSTPGGFPKDMNTQGGPVVADVGGRRTLISGNADGWIYAMDVGTGELVWKFHLSKRGINVTPVVANGRVYISHSEENIDTPDMGRVVAINATGKGDVTKTHEIWRINQLQAGFPSPALLEGKLYVVDNSANLHRINASTGNVEWTHSIGTVGKASPVLADGKIYAPETNGRFHVLAPGDGGATTLDMVELSVSEGRYAEIYGSPSIAYGRVFLATEGGLYAIGRKGERLDIPEAKKDKGPAKPVAGTAATLQVVPADVLTAPGGKVSLRVRAVDAKGRLVKAPKGTWSLDGLTGTVQGGNLVVDREMPFQTGAVVFKSGEQTAKARVRVVSGLPWEEDFESMEVGTTPSTWIGARGKFKVAELDGGKVLVQPPRERGLQRSFTYMGPPDWTDYTIQVDGRGTLAKRRRPDIGTIAAGYTLDLQGNAQKLQIRSWAAELRMAEEVDFEWEMDTWYTLKLSVDHEGDKAIVRGKAWKTGDPEPEAWTLTVEDPYPVRGGGPGLIGYAPAEVYYDNLKVWVSKP
jgi:outer membrane protein assembly factor BamB